MGLIYHYTDANGLFGILENDEFWLTDHRFVNDPSEGVYAKKVLKENIKTILSECEDSIKDGIEKFMTIPNTHRGVSSGTYVGSFSSTPNLLSQWRGYCGKDGGYCVGFDASGLRDFIPGCDLKKCNYTSDSIIRNWKHMAKRINDTMMNKGGMIEGSKPPTDKLKGEVFTGTAGKHLFEILSILITTKHPDYSEEKEIRLFNLFPPEDKDIFFRPSNGKLIPTMKVKGIKSCIQKIIVGPQGDPQLNSLALEAYKCWSEGAFDIETSQTPHRQ